MSNEAQQHKTFATTKPEPQQTNQTRTTKVNLCLSGERETISIRIKPEIKKAFTSRCKQMGLTTCHIAEGLFTAWLVGVDENLSKVNVSRTCIDLTLVRDVKRIHRYSREVVEDVYEERAKHESEGGCVVCHGVAYALVTRQDGARVCLCREHFFVEKARVVGWRVLE